MSRAPMARAEIDALPPVITLAQLARVLGVSEPVVRACHRRGELERAGIKVLRFGAQWRVATESVRAALGLAGGASTVPAGGDPAAQGRATGQLSADGGRR